MIHNDIVRWRSLTVQIPWTPNIGLITELWWRLISLTFVWYQLGLCIFYTSRSKIGEKRWEGTVCVVIVILQYSVWNFNLANNVWTLSSRFWYFTCVFILTQPFQGFQHFDFVTSTSEFGLLIENFGLVHKFSTVIARALIFHTSLYFDMIFLLVSRYVSLWLGNLWNWPLLAGFAFHKDILLYEYIYWLIGSNT